MTHMPTLSADHFTRARHQGRNYVKVLAQLHALKRPRNYLEIGTATGKTLALARCASVAIDPRFQLARDVRSGKPACHLFEMTSDAFFAAENPSNLFGGPIDLAFIDGLHWFEFALRDFMNIEAHCAPDSLIVLHDCLPVDSHMARREPRDRSLAAQSSYPNAWAGDTWKALWILQRYRPDLHIFAFDAPPSGLVVVTRLDPASTTLKQRYDEALRAAADIEPAAFYSDFDILPTSAIRRPSWISSLIGPRTFDFSAHLSIR
ncbi:MAG TPA: class I SAM-dependent methyltransferase [Dongiaceae bacterium]|nr:class I SAM-dependent methyltransferase [Dongiaceae bacterium]